MRITDAIAMEHATLARITEEIERASGGFRSRAEVGAVARVLERLLVSHGERETELGFLPLDHALRNKKVLRTLYHDHKELDARLGDVQRAPTCERARQLLCAALRASRAHFQQEEREVLPLLERALGPKALNVLGEAFKRRSGAKTRGERERRRAR